MAHHEILLLGQLRLMIPREGVDQADTNIGEVECVDEFRPRETGSLKESKKIRPEVCCHLLEERRRRRSWKWRCSR